MAQPYVHQPFPAWRFHPSLPARIVNTQQEADDLAGHGWFERPEQLPAEPPTPTQLPAEEPPARPAHMPAEGRERPTQLPAETAEPKGEFSEQAEALFATPGGDVAAQILESDDVEGIEKTRDLELTNPKYEGGRKTVLRAIEQRLSHLKG